MGSTGTNYVRVFNDHDNANETESRRVYFRDGSGNAVNIESHADQESPFFDPLNPDKNRIQIGTEERRVVNYSNSNTGRYVDVDKAFNQSYAHGVAQTVRRGRHVGHGGTELVTNGTFVSDTTGWAETSNSGQGDGTLAHNSG